MSEQTAGVGGLDRAAGASWEAERARQWQAVGGLFLRLRPVLIGLGICIALPVLVASPAPREQVVGLGVGVGVMWSFFVAEAWYCRRRVVTARHLVASLYLTLAGLGWGAFVTGGGASPLLPLLLAPVVVLFAAFGRGWAAWGGGAAALVMLIIFSVIPTGVPFPPIPAPWSGWLALLTTALSLGLLFVAVAGLVEAYQRAGRRLESTREALLEAQAAQLVELRAVSGSVAHELKNPLAAIKGLVQLMGRSGGDDPARRAKRLEVLEGQVGLMERVLEDHLSWARPLSPLRLGEIDALAVAEEIASWLEPRAAARGVAVAVEGRSAPLVADAHKLRQAILNITLNAIEASAAGGRVEVKVEGEGVAGGGAVIVVRDGGQGMSAELVARLGTPWLATSKEGGTGLGVAVAASIARQHGGALSFESAPGRGTRARLALPGRPPEGAAEAGEGLDVV